MTGAAPGAMPDAAVRLAGVSHRYGRSQALHDLSLDLAAGSMTAVVGPDGVGKSTLLGLVAGVKRLQTGEVRVLGARMGQATDRSAVFRRIAYMPQGLGRNLYPSLSVDENLGFVADLRGLRGADRAARMAGLLEATGLAPFRDRPAGKLSGGMRQKLSLCAALLHDPDLLILDEPTTGVDPLSRRQFWALIDRLRQARPGLTVIAATAYMEEAERFPQLVMMDDGRVLAAGPTAAVIADTGATRLDQAFLRLRERGGRPAPPPLRVPAFVPHPGPPAIEATGLTRRFGSFTAVDDVSFTIARGEIFGFLGSNGCGKSTTMKMLTGLLPASSGSARLLGTPVDRPSLSRRLKIGYVSQSFSLYEELSVRDNLVLHARLYRLGRAATAAGVAAALARFDLAAVADRLARDLPLGQRQRLQLAAAVLHRPEVLILDEPTSGVDPAARDLFWAEMVRLSRDDGVTIFVSTHFMDEAERCDRVSLMHDGRVLAVGRPQDLAGAAGVATLEEAFIAALRTAGPADATADTTAGATAGATADAAGAADTAAAPPAGPARPDAARLPARPPARPLTGPLAALSRLRAFALRETRELLRDPVRSLFALLAPAFLTVVFALGLVFDVEDVRVAVLDQDESHASGLLTGQVDASPYFDVVGRIDGLDDVDAPLRAARVDAVLEIPPDFGRDLLRGLPTDLGLVQDGGVPFRAETVRGRMGPIAADFEREMAEDGVLPAPAARPYRLESRYVFNQSFETVKSIVPGNIMFVTALISAMITALAVVRERESGSIINLYVSPARVGEFLLGKQLPYVLIGAASLALLTLLAVLGFGLRIKGSAAALALGGVLYLVGVTGVGLFVSTFVRTQVAALVAAAVIVVMPSIQFSGYIAPAGTLQGFAWVVGHGFPALWFQNVISGVFSRGLGFAELATDLFALTVFAVVLPALASLILRKQER